MPKDISLLALLFHYAVLLIKPANIAKVLTVCQILVFRIHTVGHLEGTSKVNARFQFEGVKVAFVLRHLHRIDLIDAVLAVVSRRHGNEVNTDCVVEALLVNNMGHSKFLVANKVAVGEILAAGCRNHADAVPTFCNALLPCGNLFCLLVVVSAEHLEAGASLQ